METFSFHFGHTCFLASFYLFILYALKESGRQNVSNNRILDEIISCLKSKNKMSCANTIDTSNQHAKLYLVIWSFILRKYFHGFDFANVN